LLIRDLRSLPLLIAIVAYDLEASCLAPGPGSDPGGRVFFVLAQHAIICNRRKKQAYSSAGAVPILVKILRDGPAASQKGTRSQSDRGPQPADIVAVRPRCADAVTALAVHAAAALGSFSCESSESSREVVAAGAVPQLCALLNNSDAKVAGPRLRSETLYGRIKTGAGAAPCAARRCASCTSANGF